MPTVPDQSHTCTYAGLHDDPVVLALLALPGGGNALAVWALSRSWLAAHPDYGLLPDVVGAWLAGVIPGTDPLGAQDLLANAGLWEDYPEGWLVRDPGEVVS